MKAKCGYLNVWGKKVVYAKVSRKTVSSRDLAWNAEEDDEYQLYIGSEDVSFQFLQDFTMPTSVSDTLKGIVMITMHIYTISLSAVWIYLSQVFMNLSIIAL